MMRDPSRTIFMTRKVGEGWRKYVHLALPLLFFLLMFLFFSFQEHFEFDRDEGGEVMKALLVSRGYPLYSQVWSDQPPLLTYLLAGYFRALGPSVNAGRTVILLFSTALLAAAAHFLRSNWGAWDALAGALLIFMLPFYDVLSVSVMFGLPAIGLAMLSLLALSTWHQRGGDQWLIVSAIALALSVFTKLFTGFLAPIFALGILLDEVSRLGKSAPRRRLFRPVLLWSLIFVAIVLAAAMFLIGPSNLPQLFTIHLLARQPTPFNKFSENLPISGYMGEAWTVLLLAGIGTVFAVLKRHWISLYLTAWAVVAYLLLTQEIPVFYHHQLLITIPVAMLAGIAVGEAIRLLPQLIHSRPLFNLRTLLVALSLAGFVATVAMRAPQTLHDFYHLPVFMNKASHPFGIDQIFLTKMSNHAAETHWVVTDVPIYAFRAGLIVPPYLSYITLKRLSTGELTEDKIIAVIQEYRPEQVLIGRRELPKVKEYIQQDYRLVYERAKKFLYIRKDLKG